MPARLAPRVAGGLLIVALAAGCGGDEQTGRDSIFGVDIPGTANPSTSTSGNTVTKLFDVTGDWTEVSVVIAETAKREGWRIESVNCVGTGNDVIAKKDDNGTWLLLESGAGERGAGIIVRPDPAQSGPAPFTVSGRCPSQLVDAAR